MWRLRQRLPLLLSTALVRRRDVCVVRYCSSGGGGSGADGDNGSVDCIQRTSALLRALVTPQRPHGVSNSGSGSDNNNATSPEVWQSACVLLRRLEAQLASVMHAQQQSGSSDTVATATVTTSAGVDSTRHRNTSSSTSSMHDVLQLLDAMLRVCMRAVVVAATQQQQQQHAHNTTLSDAALLDMCDDVYTTYHTCCLAYAHHCSSNNNTDGMPRRLQLRRCVLHIRYVRFMLAYNARTTSAAAAATTLERALCVLLLDVPALRASMTTMTAASPSSSSSSLSSVHTPTDMLLLTLAALQRALLLLPLHSCNSNSRHSLLSWLAQRDDTNSATATAAAAHDVCNALTLARTCVQQVLLRVHVPRHVKQCALARYCACCVAHAHAQQQQHEERGSSNNAHQLQRMADMPVTFAWQQQSAVAAARSAAPHRDADNVDEAVVLATALCRGVCEQLLNLTTDNTTTTRDDSGNNARRLRDEVMLTLLTRHRRAHVDDDDNNNAHSDGSGNSSSHHHAHTSRTHYSLGVWLLRALLAPLQRACAAAAGQRQQQQRWECATRQTLQLLRPLMLCVSEAQRRLVAITPTQQQQQQQQRDVQYVVQGMWRVLLDAVRDGVFALLLPTQQQQQQQQSQQQQQGDKRDSGSHTADTDTTMATSVCEAMRVLVLPLYDAPHWRRATVNVFVCLLHEWQQSSVLREVFREVQRRERHAQHRAWQHIDAHTRREEQQHDNDDQQQQQQQGNRQSGRRGGVVYVPALSLSSCELVIQHCCNTLHDPHTAAQAVHYMLLALRMAHSRVAARNDDDDGDGDDGDSDNADMGVTQAAAAAIDTSVSNNNSDNNSRGAVDGNEDDDDEEDDVSMWLQRVKQQYIPAVDALFRRSGLDSDGGWLVRGRT